MKKNGFTLIELMIVIAIIAVVAAIAIPGLMQARMAANERSASTCLKAVVTAEEVFRGSDCDRNGLNDYWTGDLCGLYAMGSPVTMKAIACLSDIGMCLADVWRFEDAFGAFMGPDIDGDGLADMAYGPSFVFGVANRSPKSGYWYQALLNDEMGNPLGIDTDGNGPCHNFGQYGFAAMPAAYDRSGYFCFIVNSVGTVLHRDFGAATIEPTPQVQQTEFAPGVPFDYPDAAAVGSNWSKVE